MVAAQRGEVAGQRGAERFDQRADLGGGVEGERLADAAFGAFEGERVALDQEEFRRGLQGALLEPGGRALVLHAESRDGVLLATRLLAAFACSLVVLLPLQAASGGHSPTRLLLLPVSRRALATSGVLAAAADPAVWLAAPSFLALGAGVASAGVVVPSMIMSLASSVCSNSVNFWTPSAP